MSKANATLRMTTAQAIVKYLQAQHSERDGKTRRLIPGVFGIFGHGNVAGLGQALYEYGGELPYYHTWNEQAMVHTVIGFAKRNGRSSSPAAESITPRPGKSCRRSPRRSVFPSERRAPAKARCGTIPLSCLAGSASRATRAPARSPARPTW